MKEIGNDNFKKQLKTNKRSYHRCCFFFAIVMIIIMDWKKKQKRKGRKEKEILDGIDLNQLDFYG